MYGFYAPMILMTSTNPLLAFGTHPHFDSISPAVVGAGVDEVLATARAVVAAVEAVAASEVSWDSVGAPLEQMGEDISRVWSQVQHMHAVQSTDEWQAAYHNNLNKVVVFWSAFGQNQKIYEKLRTLFQLPDFKNESLVRQKIVADALRDFKLAGVALPSEQAARFRANSERLAELSAQFEENVLAATNDFSLTVQSEAVLGDMPADLKTIAQQAAKQEGAPGQPKQPKQFRFTLQMPSYMAFMQYATDSALREKMYRAYHTRASDCAHSDNESEDAATKRAARNNIPLIAEIVSLRQTQARLLDFPNYATKALQTRMADSPAAVHDFLVDLISQAKPHAADELESLRQYAKESLGINNLQAWDVGYASECLRRARFDYSDAELRPYLQTQRIIAGLFACVEELFGVRMRPATAAVWDADVQYLEIIKSDGGDDEAGEVVGGLYLDLYARNTKRGGAWMADSLSRCVRGAQLQKPLAHIVCNFAKPAGDSPALLNWDEAVTLFHECGHALHHLLTEVDEFSVSGISGVEWDAVELPSQLLENFIWEWHVLEPMTAHVKSGEPMPKALFDKVRSARRFQCGMWLIRQLEFALFDWQLHAADSFSAANESDSADAQAAARVWTQVRAQTALLLLPEYHRFYCSFSHIFAGGYAAGYYSYLWAEVLAADIYELFASDDKNAWSHWGARFRDEVLRVGGSRSAMESFVALRGRPPHIAPLLNHYGLPTAE